MLAFALSCVHSRGVIAKIIAYAAIGISATLTSPSPAQQVRRATAAREAQPEYSIAFANFGPINTDIFIAAPDGSKPVPLSAHPGRDCNASFSSDGRWIIFTSDRAGSADIFRIHPDGSGIERLTDDPAFDDQGSLSPDGKSLAFVSSRGGHVSIWLLDLATRTSRNLTAGHPLSDFRPSWSPDGQWIAFSSQRDSKKPNATRVPENEIYIVRPDGSGLRRITTEQEFAGSPSWSPDSSRLVFYQGTIVEVMKIRDARHLRGTTQIVSVVVKTSERQVLTSGDGEKWSPRYLAPNRVAYVSGGPSGGIEVVANAPAARGEFGSPDWSRDGRSMVFHREVVHNWPPLQEWHSPDPKFRLIRTGVFPTYAPSGKQVVIVTGNGSSLHNGLLKMNADGSERSTLFDDPERNVLAPAWSPAGDRIAFGIGTFFQATFGQPMPAVVKGADIGLINSDSTGFKLLTKGDGNYAFPSWSSDGRQIVVRALTTNGKGLSLIDVSTGAIKTLTTGYNDTLPAWSPKGDLIAFSSNRDGDFDIYRIDVNGAGIKRLTDTPGNDAHCAWSPDGEWLAFSSARGGFKDEAALHPHNPQPYGDLYVMRSDGSDARQLTDDQYEDGTVAFVPISSVQDDRSSGRR